MLLDEDVPGDAEYERVQAAGVKRQRVVVVKAVDFYVLETHLIVGEDRVGIDSVAQNHRN